MIEQLSIDLSNYCSQECAFCYNPSRRSGNTLWTPDEVIHFAGDCIAHGVKAVSLGGGEPFEYDGIFEVIDALFPQCYLSVTSNGLPLENQDVWQSLQRHKPDKIHITIHNPDLKEETARVESILPRIAALDIKPGVNLLVGADKTEAARDEYSRLRKILNSDQIILVPQRFSNSPSPRQLASVAGGKPFQSPSCLLGCRKPDKFCSVSWDKRVNFCSFSPHKVALRSLDFRGLMDGLKDVVWSSCAHRT